MSFTPCAANSSASRKVETVAKASDPKDPIPVLIELDCDGHRSGVKPQDATLLVAIAQALAPRARLEGVLTHAGESYEARGSKALAAAAEQERAAAVMAAETLRAKGWPCPVVSTDSAMSSCEQMPIPACTRSKKTKTPARTSVTPA